MKYLFSIAMLFFASTLFSAPLAGVFTGSPLEARQRLIQEALKYENTPYLYGGMTRAGLDCSGFILLSFRDAFGISLPRSASGLYTWAERIPLESAQPGDLLFFRTSAGSSNITHVGLYLGNGRFIHAASIGPQTGVIYSNLSEQYYGRTFAGAGRALPQAAEFRHAENMSTEAVSINAGAITTGSHIGGTPPVSTLPSVTTDTLTSENGRLLLGAAIAPTWAAFLSESNAVRGFASQLRIAADTYSFGRRMVFGLELRPEYDAALGVFRLPITFSWGPTDSVRVFAGPVFSFGDASLTIDGEKRNYTGGTNWLGAAGITLAPFSWETVNGDFAFYLEAAWQSYISDNSSSNMNADFSAAFRFSTGLRWTYGIER